MMGEVSLKTSPKNIMIQDMINSENSMNKTESTNTNIFKNFHVGDCLKSLEWSDGAIKLVKELCELLSRGEFKLTKWLSNKKEVLETIPQSKRATSVLDMDLGSDNLPVETTIGVQWNMETDKFMFKVLPKRKPVRRRGILWGF